MPTRQYVGASRNANVPRRHNHEFAGHELITMLLQRLIQMLDLGLRLFPRKPEEQHAGVGKALVENQLAEIAVGNDEVSSIIAVSRCARPLP
jgi:hypothetical protein